LNRKGRKERKDRRELSDGDNGNGTAAAVSGKGAKPQEGNGFWIELQPYLAAGLVLVL